MILREQAKELGLKYYFTGRSCKMGHIDKRNTTNGVCYTCQLRRTKERQAAYYEKNSEHIKQKAKDWHYSNQERYKTRAAEYRAKHREQIALRDKLYREASRDKFLQYRTTFLKNHPNYRTTRGKLWWSLNRHLISGYTRNRRSRSKVIPGWCERDLIKQLYTKRDELNTLWNTTLQVDHIIPLNPKDDSVCGLHCWANLQLLDAPLNNSKGDMYETDW